MNENMNPTTNENTPVTNDEILAFVQAVSEKTNSKLRAQYPTCDLNWDTIVCQIGSKYAKLIRRSPGCVGGSAHCFVEMATGNILKAAGWSKPAKGIRGNIRNGEAANWWNGALTVYGAAYAR